MTSFIAAVSIIPEIHQSLNLVRYCLSIKGENDIVSIAMNRTRFLALFVLVASALACQTTDILSSYPASPTETPTRTRVPTRPIITPVTQPTQPPIAIIATPTPAEISATANDNANIRSLPSTGAAIAARVTKGQQLTLTGRTAASDWYLVKLPANPNAQGWISAPLVRAEGAEQLPVVQPGNVPPPYPGR